MPELTADTLLQDRYRIVRQLGKGGMGAVYEAVDERLGITVALKETLSAEAGGRKQFEHEARLLASLQHPALPRVTDHFTEGNRAFLVMQFIAGVDLARIIYQQPGPFPRDQVVAWADQLLDALIYLHTRDRQVVHRDIKPHNLKLTATGQIALLDFGLARAQKGGGNTTSAFSGYTRQYAPLEQIQDLSSGPQGDIYALGATLYHLLTGVKPADALTRAASLARSESDPLKPANVVHPAVGPEIAAILRKAMAQKPADRYRDASEFREALRRVGRRPIHPARSEPQHAEGTIFSKSYDDIPLFKTLDVGGYRRRGPVFVASVTLILLLAVIGVVYGYQHWDNWPVTELPQKSQRVDAVPRTTGVSRKSEKAPTNSNALLPDAAKNPDVVSRKQLVEKNSIAEGPSPGSDVKQALPVVIPRLAATRLTRVESSRQIKIPDIKLPDAEIRDRSMVPNQAEVPDYGPQGSFTNRLPSTPLLPQHSWVWRPTERSRTLKFSHRRSRVMRAKPLNPTSEV